jgi:nitrite reductase/ring-hydroxylating ferredoxin subunit
VVRPSISAQVADFLGEDFSDPDPGVRAKPSRLPIAQALRQCSVGELVAAHDQGQAVALAVLEDGTQVVVPDTCPHDGGLLSDGFIEGNFIVCARHGWEFDGHSGQCTLRPDVQVRCRSVQDSDADADS